MSLYEQWVKKAYDKDGQTIKDTWDAFIPLEQRIYEDMLANKEAVVAGTPQALAQQYGMSVEYVCGFLDGFNDASDVPINIEELEEDTELNMRADLEKLYKKMVEYKARHLYTLSQWDNVFPPDKQKALYSEQKNSGTIVKGEKPSRNDPCPCGSGKKYKKCCGVA